MLQLVASQISVLLLSLLLLIRCSTLIAMNVTSVVSQEGEEELVNLILSTMVIGNIITGSLKTSPSLTTTTPTTIKCMFAQQLALMDISVNSATASASVLLLDAERVIETLECVVASAIDSLEYSVRDVKKEEVEKIALSLTNILFLVIKFVQWLFHH